MPHNEHRANLEQGLTVARHQFVEDEAPGLVIEGTEDIDHTSTIGKLSLAYQMPIGWLGPTDEERLTPAVPEQGSVLGQAVLMAEISNSRVTLSLTKTPPVSSATFQVTP